MKRLHAWAHRKGIARILNSGDRSALVEVRGPSWAVEWLACWTVRHYPYMTVD